MLLGGDGVRRAICRRPLRCCAVIAVVLNVLLAVFNMIPVPPLDGGNVLAGSCRSRCARLIDELRPYGFFLLYALHVDRRARHASCSRSQRRFVGLAVVTSRQRVVSGMRPTGRLHLGHLVGALRELGRARAAKYDCFYFVADWHALTSHYASTERDRRRRARQRRPTGSAPASIPEKSTLFVQSIVPEHAELYLLLQMVTPISVARARADLQGTDRAADREGPVEHRVSRLSACCRPPTSSSTTRTSCRSARTRCRTSSCRARSCGASTTSTARSSSSRSRC